MTLNEISGVADAISGLHDQLATTKSALEIAQLHNRWYHARLIELVKAVTSVNAIEYQHPAVQSAVKNANNLISGLERK